MVSAVMHDNDIALSTLFGDNINFFLQVHFSFFLSFYLFMLRCKKLLTKGNKQIPVKFMHSFLVASSATDVAENDRVTKFATRYTHLLTKIGIEYLD